VLWSKPFFLARGHARVNSSVFGLDMNWYPVGFWGEAGRIREREVMTLSRSRFSVLESGEEPDGQEPDIGRRRHLVFVGKRRGGRAGHELSCPYFDKEACGRVLHILRRLERGEEADGHDLDRFCILKREGEVGGHDSNVS
jgi:hypothetical protein